MPQNAAETLTSHRRTGAGAVRCAWLPMLALAAVLMLASACQRSTGGPLEPVPSGGVEAGPDRSAVVHDGNITARVTGRWSATGENSLRVTYRTAGPSSRMIAVEGLKMTHPAGEAALRTAVDATGVDLADARADNDRPRVLFALQGGAGAPSALDLPPGASRDVDAELTSFSNDRAVKSGDRVVATIPMGDRAATVTFVAQKP